MKRANVLRHLDALPHPPPPDVDTPRVVGSVPIRETPTARSPGHNNSVPIRETAVRTPGQDDDNNTVPARETTVRSPGHNNPDDSTATETPATVATTRRTNPRPNTVTSVISAFGTTPTRIVHNDGSPSWPSRSQESPPLPQRTRTPSRRASLVGSVPHTNDNPNPEASHTTGDGEDGECEDDDEGRSRRNPRQLDSRARIDDAKDDLAESFLQCSRAEHHTLFLTECRDNGLIPRGMRLGRDPNIMGRLSTPP